VVAESQRDRVATLPVRVVASLVRRADTSQRIRKHLDALLTLPDVTSTILHRVSATTIRAPERIGDVAPPGFGQADTFDDVTWLFSSNYANRGVSQLMLDEAAWLFRRIQSYPGCTVAEVGRCKGGTTVLLAAAGAHVVSLDNGQYEQGLLRRGQGDTRPGTFLMSLEETLTGLGLSARVELIEADAMTFPLGGKTFDWVYLDIPLPVTGCQQLFDHWWPAVETGGALIIRDGAEPRTPGPLTVAKRLADRPDVKLDPSPPGRFVVAYRT